MPVRGAHFTECADIKDFKQKLMGFKTYFRYPKKQEGAAKAV